MTVLCRRLCFAARLKVTMLARQASASGSLEGEVAGGAEEEGGRGEETARRPPQGREAPRGSPPPPQDAREWDPALSCEHLTLTLHFLALPGEEKRDGCSWQSTGHQGSYAVPLPFRLG